MKETGLEINAWKSIFSSKHGNEPSGSIKGREFPSLVSDNQVVKDSVPLSCLTVLSAGQ
jgi:hypothetical protein